MSWRVACMDVCALAVRQALRVVAPPERDLAFAASYDAVALH